LTNKSFFSVKRRRKMVKHQRALNGSSKRRRSVTKTVRGHKTVRMLKTLMRRIMRKKIKKMMSLQERANRKTKIRTSPSSHGKKRRRASFLNPMVEIPSLRDGLERSQLLVLFISS